MDNLLEKMKEYLKMDTEIPFSEFTAYYNELIKSLQSGYEGMENKELFQAKYILTIVASNARNRAQRKGPESKKYKKMGDKCSFWSDAINYRLVKSGLSQQEIDEQVAAVNPEEEEEKQP